jgi:hypothetical protein
VVELAWTVLEAAAAAGLLTVDSSSSSSSSSSGDYSRYDSRVAAILQLAAGISYELGSAYLHDRATEQWPPHAQQFASDALLKLLLMTAGLLVREGYEQQQGRRQQQQQQQQQGQQVCLQPYHQQLLAELKVQPSERLTNIAYNNFCPCVGLQACSALAFALQARELCSSSSGSSSSSGDNSSVLGTAGATRMQPAGTAVSPGISSRLQELLILTVLEYAVLASVDNGYLLADALMISICLLGLFGGVTDDAVAAMSELHDQFAPGESNALLQCLLLELGPAVLRSTRDSTAAGSAAGSAAAAAAAAAGPAAAASSSTAHAEWSKNVIDGTTCCLALLCAITLFPGKLWQLETLCSR